MRRLSRHTANIFVPRYIQRIKGLQPISYFPLNEKEGRVAHDVMDPTNIGMHFELAVGDAVGPDLETASTYQNANETSRTLISGANFFTNVDADLGSIMLWYKAAYTDNGTKILINIEKDGNNYLKIRRLHPLDGYDFMHNIGAVLCDVKVANAESTWKCIVTTWDKVNDRVRIYFHSTTPVADSTMGVWAGPMVKGIIGANTITGGNPADGCIKHLAIFDYELTAAQVQTCLNIRGGNRSKHLPSRAANAAAALAIDTYDESDECTHPSVIDFVDDWNGYRYWMALTPLPGGDNEFENPQIMASADGDTWVEPGAIDNPIDDWPGEGFWNSDVNLMYDGTNLVCLYRSYDPGPWQGIHYRSSTDGETWSAEGDVLAVANNLSLSPSCLLDGTTYKMWMVDELATPNKVTYRTAAAITGAWSSATDCVVPLPAYLEPWHLEVVLVGSVFELWVTAKDTRSGETGIALFRLTSTDGINFSNCETILQPDPNQWDGRFQYKASVQSDGAGGYVIWYGGTDEDNVWKIGKTVYS